jgi:hypothetical protein
MYKCLVFPYPIRPQRAEKILPIAYDFIAAWEAETACTGDRPHIMVKCFGEPRRKVFIDAAFRHIDHKFVPNIARRYRLLPCVRELLMESTEKPVPTRDGNLILEGKAPTKEVFRVILGAGEEEDGHVTYKLLTFYPVSAEGRR